MAQTRTLIRLMCSSRSGSTAIEAAIVIPVFLLALERVALDAGRQIKLQAHSSRITEADVKNIVKQSTSGLLRADTHVFIVTETTNRSIKPQTLSGPERCLQSGSMKFDGKYCSTSAPFCPSNYLLEDVDSNGLCSGTGDASPGGAGSIVRFLIFYDWQIVTPAGYISQMFGSGDDGLFSDRFSGAPMGVKRMVAGGAVRNEY
jgi:hypothetical protein